MKKSDSQNRTDLNIPQSLSFVRSSLGLAGFLIFTMLSFKNLAWAGGWTSGGGELIRHAQNPWYLSNTKTVNYCIQIDEQKFGQSKNFVREKILTALNFWKRNLPDLIYMQYYTEEEFNVQIGTQTFLETDCNSHPDIIFQFAYLTPEQKQRLGDLSKTVAVTVRTDYDLKNLKGKGFIYFNNNEQFDIKPWTRTEGSRLLPLLIHEMGHIFGIQHSEHIQFMEDRYAEELISNKGDDAGLVDRSTELLNGPLIHQIKLFKFNPINSGAFRMCLIVGEPIPFPKPKPFTKKILDFRLSSKTQLLDLKSNYTLSTSPKSSNHWTPLLTKEMRFFGRKEKDNCKSFSFKNNELIVESGQDKFQTIGSAKLQLLDQDFPLALDHRKSAIHLWIPAEQTVFKCTDLNCQLGLIERKIVTAFFFHDNIFKGLYSTYDGKIKRPVAVVVGNSGQIHSIKGELDGEVLIDAELGY